MPSAPLLSRAAKIGIGVGVAALVLIVGVVFLILYLHKHHTSQTFNRNPGTGHAGDAVPSKSEPKQPKQVIPWLPVDPIPPPSDPLSPIGPSQPYVPPTCDTGYHLDKVTFECVPDTCYINTNDQFYKSIGSPTSYTYQIQDIKSTACLTVGSVLSGGVYDAVAGFRQNGVVFHQLYWSACQENNVAQQWYNVYVPAKYTSDTWEWLNGSYVAVASAQQGVGFISDVVAPVSKLEVGSYYPMVTRSTNDNTIDVSSYAGTDFVDAGIMMLFSRGEYLTINSLNAIITRNSTNSSAGPLGPPYFLSLQAMSGMVLFNGGNGATFCTPTDPPAPLGIATPVAMNVQGQALWQGLCSLLYTPSSQDIELAPYKTAKMGDYVTVADTYNIDETDCVQPAGSNTVASRCFVTRPVYTNEICL